MTCVIATTNLRCGELPSTEINEVGLQPIANVLLKYSSLRVERQIGKLDVKLAQEAIFGDSVLEQCTPKGWNNLPALPQVELNMLKVTLFWKFYTFLGSCRRSSLKETDYHPGGLAQACKILGKM